MSIHPGYSGQQFMPEALDRIARLRAALPADMPIQVDGGIDEETITGAHEAGVSLFVAGSAIFGEDDAAAAYRRLAQAVA
jgi:ribulose-phosphate 3-epimerase